jgi:exodeoxyribonuclease VII small subunit
MARSPAPEASKPVTEHLTYEQAIAELDRLVAQMEGGQLPLDQMLDGYKRGAVLLNLCRSQLQAVEAQVKVLDEGQLKSWTQT